MYFMRVIISTAKYNLIAFYRVFRAISLAMRFFMPLLSISTAWILYNRVFHGEISSEFESLSYVDYLTFIMIGNAVFVYIYGGVFETGRILYFRRLEGVLDPLFLTPMSRFAFMIGTVSISMLNATLDFLVLLFIGVIFGMDISSINIPIFLCGLVMIIVSFFSMGLIINGVTLTLRDQVNTVNFLQTILYTFSGVVVPVEMMPSWAQIVSKVSPLTYGLKIIRGSICNETNFSDFTYEFFILFLMSAVMIVVGIYFLKIIECNLKKNSKLTVI
jgi:ABC-2 type transport system permease protein